MCTSPARASRPAAGRGFSLVEVLVALWISSIVLAGVLTTTVELTRSGIRVSNCAEMDSQVRRALAQLESDLKAANSLTWNSASDITVTIPRVNGTSVQYTYAWCNLTLCLFRVPGASSAIYTGRQELVQGVPAIAGGTPGVTFARLDRNGQAATSDAATKCIQISMTVSRAVGVAAANTARVSATYTLRNKRVSS